MPGLPDGSAAILRRHRAIGWDLDGTLIGHPASAGMHGFIRQAPEIRHVIITFRSRTDPAAIWAELAATGFAAPPSCFAALETIDGDLAEHVQRLRRHRAAGLFAGPSSPIEMRYRHWKGTVCARWQASLLIDDLTDDVSPGCAAHGIALLHPDTLLASPGHSGL